MTFSKLENSMFQLFLFVVVDVVRSGGKKQFGEKFSVSHSKDAADWYEQFLR